MDHERIGPGLGGDPSREACIVYSATYSGHKRDPAGDGCTGSRYHPLGFLRGQRLALAGIAVGRQNMHTGRHSTINHGL